MIAYHDVPYLELVQDILATGNEKDDRTGTGTKSVFGRQMRFRLHDNVIPLLTTKKMHTRSIIHELLWYFKGDTNIKYLNDNGVTIWDEWADENGDLGPVYGAQWRRWNTGKTFWAGDCDNDPSQGGEQPLVIDQLKIAIDTIKKNPNSRRILVSAWNVSELDEMALLPCHVVFQFNVVNDRLSCMLFQRSCDVGLGVPFNIVQYSILTCMVAHVTGLKPGDFIWTGGDVHIYKNHIEALKEQVTRQAFLSPTLWLNPDVKDIDQFTFDDVRIEGYQAHPAIRMEVSV